MIEWDGEYHVLRWSAGAEHIFGWKAEEVLGQNPRSGGWYTTRMPTALKV